MQVRAYGPYAVCQSALSGGEGNEMADPFAMGASFATLAGAASLHACLEVLPIPSHPGPSVCSPRARSVMCYGLAGLD